MFEKVLVPLDGSKVAETALSWSRLLSGSEGRLSLIRVVPVTAWGDLHVPTTSRARDQAEGYVRGLAAAGIETRVTSGSIVESILAAADRFGAGAITMTSTGGGGLAKRMFGSTSEKLLHASPRPVLIIPPDSAQAPARLHTIIVPLDGSPAAESAIESARHLARRDAANVTLVHAIRDRERLDTAREQLDALGAPEEARRLIDEFESSMAGIRDRIGKTAASLQAEGIKVKIEYPPGDPVAALGRLVRTEGADLIVMSAHGHGAVGRLLVGSVTSGVLRSGCAPVLVLRRPPDGPGGV